MLLLDNKSQKCTQLGKFLKNCPKYGCMKTEEIDLDHIYDLTVGCFNDLNMRVQPKTKTLKKKTVTRKHGGQDNMSRQCSGKTKDGKSCVRRVSGRSKKCWQHK